MPIIPDDVATRAHLLTDHLGWWSPQKDIRRAIARAILAERRRCMAAVKAAPHFIYHSEEEFAETGMIGRQANRADLCAAIQGPTT